jgi:ABC-type multidrug transport system permease subunit
MYKLISIILAAIPFILFLRAIFIGRLRRSRAVSDFRKQIDYLVWIILILIVCGLIYSLGKLILAEGTLSHFQG